MPQGTALRRTGRFVTGLGALAILVGILVGGPIALLAFAGNPLPDHLPTLGEITTVLTSRDDGQLFLRGLALLGWAGWATFALSVLVEVPARILRRPAIRLPGLARQQRAAAALVGSVAMILAFGPAATATASALAAAPAAAAATAHTGGTTAQTGVAAALTSGTATTGPAAPAPVAVPVTAAGPAPRWLAAAPGTSPDEPAPVYRVEKDDYLGHIAGRYLGDFDRYPELARMNKLQDPDRIRPGQLLRLPEAAVDHGFRPHASGLVAVPPPAESAAPAGTERTRPDRAEQAKPGATEQGKPGATERAKPGDAERAKPGATERVKPGDAERAGRAGMGPAAPDAAPDTAAESEEPPVAPIPEPRRPSPGDATEGTTFASASPAGENRALNRPLAVAAVIAAASIVGAHIGALLGLRRQTAPARRDSNGRHRRPTG